MHGDETMDTVERHQHVQARPGQLEGKRLDVKQLDSSKHGTPSGQRECLPHESHQSELLSLAHLVSLDSATLDHHEERTPEAHPTSHYRIAFKEVCTSLNEQEDLGVVFDALSATCNILERLHSVRWVHRDISPGNILIYETEDKVLRAKLSDVEYAKRRGSSDDEPHEVRTGSEEFMSVEVRKSRYLFRDSQTHPTAAATTHRSQKPRPFGDNSLRGPNGRPDGPRGPRPARSHHPRIRSPRWFYNPLHDLESIWWLMAFFVVSKELGPLYLPGATTRAELVEDAPDHALRVQRQAQYAARLFVAGSQAVYQRQDVFAHMSDEQLSDCLHPCLFPLSMDIEEARDALVRCYRAAEREPGAVGHRVAEGVYATLRGCLERMLLEVSNEEYDLKILMSIYEARQRIKDQAHPVKGSVKRKAGGEDADDDGAVYNDTELDTHSTAPATTKSKRARNDPS